MTSQTTIKVRLVLCPKCKQLLSELPGFSVYQCGGCGTTLQAKKREDDTKDTGSRLHEADAAEKKEPDHVSEDKKASSINQNATVHSTEESAFNKSNETEQREFKDDNLEQPRFIHSSDELSSLTRLNCCDNEEPSLEAGTHKEVDEECLLDHNNRRNHKESGGSNFSGEVSSSTEHHSQENVELSPCDGADSEADENEYPLVRKNRRKQKKIEDYNREGPRNGMVSNEISSSSKLTVHDIKEMNQNEDSNFSVEVSSSTELNCHKNEELVPVPEASIKVNENKYELLPVPEASIEVNENKYSLEQKHERVQSEFGDYKECRGSINVSNEVSSSPKLTCHEIEEPSPTAGEDDDFKSRFIFGGSSAKNLLTSKPKDQPQKSVSHGFGRVSSVDTLEDTQVHPSAELNLKHRSVGKSPKNRSYDAYQSSVSSYDGIENQVPKQHQYVFQRNFKDVIPRRDDEYMLSDEYMLNNTMLSDSEMKHQERKSASTLPEKKRYATEVSKWKRGEWPESTRNRASQSMLEFYSRDSQMGFENGNPLNYGHKDFESSSSFQSPVKPKYLEEEKMELLRMVYELENQLNRLEVSKERANGRFQKEKRIPPCYPEVCICNDLKYHRHPRRCSLGKTGPQKCKMTRVPFSEEVTTGRHQVEYSHFRGCRPDLPYSAPLPPYPKCYSKGKYTALHGHKCRIPNNFSPSSQHFSSSEISSWSCETESLDHRRRNREMEKPYLMGGRHFRPIAGGAPFVSCYHCSKLLQLPSDFLLFTRRFHQLQCSACSVVLKFTVQNKTHIVPYTPGVTVAPPPSEVDDHSNQRKLAAHANDRADHVLCTDDYERSFRRIGSASVTPPFGILKRDSDDRKKRHVLKASENKHKNHVETLESAVPSSEKSKVVKLSSEIKEAPPRTGSPLHRLMGYSSPSQVIKW